MPDLYAEVEEHGALERVFSAVRSWEKAAAANPRKPPPSLPVTRSAFNWFKDLEYEAEGGEGEPDDGAPPDEDECEDAPSRYLASA